MTTPAPDIVAPDKGLKRGALGLVSSVVVGLASTAPAYSLAATLGLVIAAGGTLLAGVKAPAIMLISFVPMYLIAVAYQELNKAEPDCGTTFTWAARAFGPAVGWLGGWGIIASDVIVMANLARHAKVDPEDALRRANAKFTRRFAQIEAGLAARGKTPAGSTLEEMDALWNEARAADKLARPAEG